MDVRGQLHTIPTLLQGKGTRYPPLNQSVWDVGIGSNIAVVLGVRGWRTRTGLERFTIVPNDGFWCGASLNLLNQQDSCMTNAPALQTRVNLYQHLLQGTSSQNLQYTSESSRRKPSTSIREHQPKTLSFSPQTPTSPGQFPHCVIFTKRFTNSILCEAGTANVTIYVNYTNRNKVTFSIWNTWQQYPFIYYGKN
jgi:hypothetical protein